jgi:hypothetical protein
MDDSSGLISSTGKKTDVTYRVARAFKNRYPYESGSAGNPACGFQLSTTDPAMVSYETPMMGIIMGTSFLPLFSGLEKNDTGQVLKDGEVYVDYGWYMGYPVSVKVHTLDESRIEFIYSLTDLPEELTITFKAKTIIDITDMTWVYSHFFESTYTSKAMIAKDLEFLEGSEEALNDWVNAPNWVEVTREEMSGNGVFYLDGTFWGTGGISTARETYEEDELLWKYKDQVNLRWDKDSTKLTLKGYDFLHSETDTAHADEILDSGFFSPIYDDINYSISYYYSGVNAGYIEEDYKSVIRYCAPIAEPHNYFWAYEIGLEYNAAGAGGTQPPEPDLTTYKSTQVSHTLYKPDCSGSVSYIVTDHYWDKTTLQWKLSNQFEDNYELPPCYEEMENPTYPYEPQEELPGYLTLLLTNFPDETLDSFLGTAELGSKTIHITLNSNESYYYPYEETLPEPQSIELSISLPDSVSSNTQISVQTDDTLMGFIDIEAWIDVNENGIFDGETDPSDSVFDGDFILYDFAYVEGDTVTILGESFGDEPENSEFWTPHF